MLHSSTGVNSTLEFGVTEIQDGSISRDYIIAGAGEEMSQNINNRQTSRLQNS